MAKFTVEFNGKIIRALKGSLAVFGLKLYMSDTFAICKQNILYYTLSIQCLESKF